MYIRRFVPYLILVGNLILPDSRERPGASSNFSLIAETSSTLELDVYILFRFSLICKYVNLEQAQYI